MNKNIFSEILAFLLIILFVYAAFSKLFNFSEFKYQLEKSPIINKYALLVAVILPATELLTSFMLAIRQTRNKGFIAAFVLMSLFTLYIIYMLLYEKHLPCSCGGVLKQMTWKQHLIFNLIFTGIAFAGIITETKLKNIVVRQ